MSDIWRMFDEPGYRTSGVMEYDTGTHNIDLFGGFDSTQPVGSQAKGDTWWYNNGSTAPWSQCTRMNECLPVRSTNCTAVTQSAPPCIRYGHRSAWFDDGTTKEMVIFGSAKPFQLNDVWFFTGGTNTNANWEKWVLIGTPPATRCCMGMAFDSAQDKILIYGGGHGTAPAAWDDTWSWTPSGGWVCLDDPVEASCDT